jgi:Cd2+/Zn2+-exporting ATPase
MTKKQKRMLKKILIAFGCYLAFTLLCHFVEVPFLAELIVYAAIYLYIAQNILKKAIENIGSKQMMDENFLMTVASIGAFVLGEYSEAVAVILFYQIGEWFQSYAVDRSRKSISDLMDIRPDYANIEKDGKVERVDPESVQIGQEILIYPGERVPLDGVVVSGDSSMDTAALTGESVPRQVHEGDEVISGCINQNGLLKVRVTKTFENSTVAKILDLVENATDKKAESEKFITRFARYYTPAVVYSAIALAIIPSLITKDFATWIYRALEFLVISCPCALVISVPLSFFGGIGGASKCGILVKGSNYLELLGEVDTMVFDKTGTLTKGTFTVNNVFPVGMNSEDLLALAAKAESRSSHPIARSIVQAAGEVNMSDVESIKEEAGHGIVAQIGGKQVGVGNAKLMKFLNVEADLPVGSGFGTCIYVSVDGVYAGMIEIGDVIKEDAKTVIALLKQCGVKKCVMLTGDNENVAKAVAKELNLDEVHFQLLPAQKVEQVESLLAQESKNGKLAFVGDGINDAPVLTRADVGIAMGGLGSDAAIEAADVVLMDDQLPELVTAMKISRKTVGIVRQNIVFAIGVKFLVLILGALGIVNMWAAVFADVGVAFLCILNATRALNVSKMNVNAKN